MWNKERERERPVVFLFNDAIDRSNYSNVGGKTSINMDNWWMQKIHA
jgi:hypothetical protein